MYRILLLTFSLLSAFTLFAQGGGNWTTFLRASTINATYETPTATLLATDAGIIVLDVETLALNTIWTRNSYALPSNQIESITKHPQTQELVIGTYDLGVFILRDADDPTWEPIAFPENLPNLNLNGILTYCIAYDDQNRLLVGTNKGLLIRDVEEEWSLFGPQESNNLVHEVWSMLTTEAGSVFVGGNMLMQVREGVTEMLAPVPIVDENFENLHFSYGDRKLHLTETGDLWSISDLGEVAYLTSEGEWTLYNSMSNTQLSVYNSNFIDPEGDFYLQSFSGDYYRFVDTAFVAVETPAGLEDVKDIFKINNKLVGHRSDSLVVRNDVTVDFLGNMGNWPLADKGIVSLFNDQEGNTWGNLDYTAFINFTTETIIPFPTSSTGANQYSQVAFDATDTERIWLKRFDQVVLWENFNTVSEFPYAQEPTATNVTISELALSVDGTPWFYNSEKEIYTLINGEWVLMLSLAANHYVHSFTPYENDLMLLGLYVGGQQQRVYRLLGPNTNEVFNFPSELDPADYWAPYYGGVAGSLWFQDSDNSRLVHFASGEVSYVDLPLDWLVNQYGADVKEMGNYLVMALDDRVGIWDGNEWRVYLHENTPMDTKDIHGISFDQEGKLYITHGTYRFALEILDTELVSSVRLIAQKGAVVETLPTYPNPASNWTKFDSEAGQFYQLLDMNGRVILRGSTTAQSTSIQLEGLPAGTYVLKCSGKVARLIVR